MIGREKISENKKESPGSMRFVFIDDQSESYIIQTTETTEKKREREKKKEKHDGGKRKSRDLFTPRDNMFL